MFSSACVVTSATRCCTSLRTGWLTREYRYAVRIISGDTARAIRASCQSMSNSTPTTITTVTMFWEKNTRP